MNPLNLNTTQLTVVFVMLALFCISAGFTFITANKALNFIAFLLGVLTGLLIIVVLTYPHIQ